MDTAGDGVFATFGQPAGAIECAVAIVDGAATMNIRVRVGIHMGEVEVSGREVRGIAVHIGARIMSIAGPGEVLVSSTVRDSIAGSEVRFDDRGLQELKGVPVRWQLFAVQTPLRKEAPEVLAGVPPARRPMHGRLPRRWIAAAALVLAVAAAVALVITNGGGTRAHHPPAPGAGDVASQRVAALDNAAVQFDPASGRVRTAVTGLVAGNATYRARHIEVGEGGVWVDTAITLQHIDPRTGTIVAQIHAQPLMSTIAVGQGAIWAAGNVGITRISPATDKVEATIPYDTGAARPIRIAVDGSKIWMLVTDGRLIAVDAGTNRITSHLQIGIAGIDLAVSQGALWVLDPLGDKVIEVDPTTGRILRQVGVAGNLDRLVVGSGELWVLDVTAGVVTPIDPTTGARQAPIRVGANPVDMAFGLHAVWVANRGDGTITRIDPASLTTQTIKVARSLAAIATDSNTRTLWVYLTQPDAA